ncbi:MAG: glycosyltransferase [Myxococcales bacterium]|nr:glycosyltransferase [Myxococcales bacterium]
MIALVLAIAIVALAPVGVGVWRWRLHQVARLRSQRGPASRPPPRVSIIVPARDEAHNLPRLLASLARLAPAAHEIIVVDDHSTDGTGELARAAGAWVITPPPLPPGWLGKSWACHAGAQVATGDHLLFTDADTEHGPDALALALDRAATAELVSIIPTHRVEAGWERLQGPFQLMLLVAGRAGADADAGARRYSIGQYLLFERGAYERAGGHAAIAGEIAEDLHLAARVVDSGGRFGLVHAPGALGVRMYPEGAGAFARGWRRSFRAGLAAAGAGGAAEMIAVIAWLAGVPLGLVVALALAAWPWAIAAGVAYLATAAMLARDQRAVADLPWWSALAFPIPTLAFIAISTVAAVDHARGAPVRWRGRTVALPASRGGGA